MRKRDPWRVALLVIGCLTQSCALAQQTGMSIGQIVQAATASGDLSRQGLVAIFGQVVNDPLASSVGGGDTILASVFQVTNAALLSIAVAFGGWLVLKKVGASANDGTVFDRGRGVLFGPIRVLLSFASLAPTANGWSLAQLVMLWAASIMGVGTANIATVRAVDVLKGGQSMVVAPVMPSTAELARSLYTANLCMYALNLGLDDSGAQGGFSGSNYVQAITTPSGIVFKSPSYVCGGADVTSALQQDAMSIDAADIDVSDVKRAHLDALAAMQNTVSQGARNFVQAVVAKVDNAGVQLPLADVAIQSAAQQYENIVNAKAMSKPAAIAALESKITTSLKTSGWWALGSWYQVFAQANTKLSEAVAAKARVFGPALVGDKGIENIYEKVMGAYAAQRSQTTAAQPIGAVETGDSDKAAAAAEPSAIIGSVFSKPGIRLVNWAINLNTTSETNSQVNPLIAMKNLGDYVLTFAETSLAAYGVAKATIAIAKGNSAEGLALKGFNLFTGGVDVAESVLDTVGPLLYLFVLALMGLGISLSIYLPLVPFIVWFGAVINWLVVVGEAIIAAPLWALTHLTGEGDGMGHRSGHGYIFLLNVMVRPLLMVVGFFLGGGAMIVAATLLNKLFGISLANAQFDSITGVVSCIAFIWIYCSLCVNLVHRCFNLILIVPDQVINWIGGHASTALGRDTSDAAHRSINILAEGMGKHLGNVGAGQGREERKPVMPSGNGMRATPGP